MRSRFDVVNYLRFVVVEVDPCSKQQQGIFFAAGKLLDSGDLGLAEREELNETLAWFNAHLPVPDNCRIGPTATFWFKADAKECINRIWLLVNLLRLHGHIIEVQRRNWLNIVYADEFQVAAHLPK